MPNKMTGTPTERRDEVSKAQRALIRETAVLVHEQTYQKLTETPLTGRILERHEPVITRDIQVVDAKLITRPRAWVKDILATLGRAHFTQITVTDQGLRLVGRWSDVQLAEWSVQRTLLLADQYATAAYRNRYREVAETGSKRALKRNRGARKKWLKDFVAFTQVAIGAAYESLAEVAGYERLESVVGNFDHVLLPAVVDDVRARKHATRALKAG